MPAEQAILISHSKTRTIQEKLKALQEIIEIYSEKEFQYDQYGAEINFRKIVINTIKCWKEASTDMEKENSLQYIYSVHLTEKDCNDTFHERNVYLDSYEGAYQYLVKEKQVYLDNENLMDCITTGRIQRIKLNDTRWYYEDNYYFDDNLKLIDLLPSDHITKKYPGGNLCYPYPWCDYYDMFIPAPFKTGDIVKVESPYFKTIYGVFSHEWKEPKSKGWGSLVMSLDMYDSDTKKFWYTDNTSILEMEYCPEEELPKEEHVLKDISKVRKGDLDFFYLLYKYNELNEIFK